MKNELRSGEDYTSDQINEEIHKDVSESLSDILARQRNKERGFNLIK